MSSILKAADRTVDRLVELLGQLSRPDGSPPTRCWIEAPDGWAFWWWPGVDGTVRWCRAAEDPAETSVEEVVRRSYAGRVFAPDGELRWRVIPALGENCCRIVFLGTADWCPEALNDYSHKLAGMTRETKSYILWGQQTDVTPGEWIELRIPHRFQYPIDGNPRGVRLVTEHWRDASGQPHFIRYCDLKPFEETR